MSARGAGGPRPAQRGCRQAPRSAHPAGARAIAAATIVAAGLPSMAVLGPWGAAGATSAARQTRSPAGLSAALGRGGRAKTFLGPYGVESPAVIAENKRPGTTSWQLSGTHAKGYIEGFANRTYAAAGNRFGLYVSTSAHSFRVVAYRMGYYQGKGGRQVWASPRLPGRAQPACPVTPVTNMVSCENWHRSITVTVPSTWPSGDYLLKLIGSGGQQGYVQLTVWDPSSHSAYLVMARSLTEQAWNPFGGYDLYQGEGTCPPGSATYPPCNRARVVSFDRPYGWGAGAADFLGNEYPLVRWAEQHGLDVSYCTDITVSAHPGVLLDHRALLSLDHDEVWTNSERLAALVAQARGINVVFFGAAPVLRHARLQSSPLGRDQEEVDYRDAAEDPLDAKANPDEVTGNTWSSPPTNWDEAGFVGEMYSGYMVPNAPPAAFVVWDPSSWLFKRTGLTKGSSVPDVIASDIDHLDPSGPLPADLQVMGHSPVPLAEAYTNQGTWGNHTFSDMTYYTDRKSGGGVFDSGTVNWLTALATCTRAACPATKLGRITGNLLSVFGRGPAGRSHPSVPNWRSVTPPGS
ncbi:MAG: N,N-dimethylformamidase beta subunit family domain-containing protein [Acidimicrobiales bacterium]